MYEFPVIEHIDQFVDALDGYPEFAIRDKGQYTVITYDYQDSETFLDPLEPGISGIEASYRALRRECRGIIFDRLTGQLLSRPYHKFFNFGEKPETFSYSGNSFILEKLDGSMIRPLIVDGELRLATKAGLTDTSALAEEWMNTDIGYRDQYRDFCLDCIEQGITPIFEWCSRQSKIVIDYPEDRLVLTGARRNRTGDYITYSYLVGCSAIETVKRLDLKFASLADIVKHTKPLLGQEGFVVRFDNGHMLKIKADQYLLLHSTKEKFNTERAVVELILNDAMDDLLPILETTDKERLCAYNRVFQKIISDKAEETLAYLRSCRIQLISRKDFAINHVPKIPEWQRIVMFNLYAKSGASASDFRVEITNVIKKSLTHTATFDNIKDQLFKGLKW